MAPKGVATPPEICSDDSGGMRADERKGPLPSSVVITNSRLCFTMSCLRTCDKRVTGAWFLSDDSRIVPLSSGNDAIQRLHAAVVAARLADPGRSRTARLIAGGRSKMAKKLVEEAAEVAIDAVAGNRDAVIAESADLLYNLTVLWSDLAIRPEDVWDEMARREQLYGLAEKRHKGPVAVGRDGRALAPPSGDGEH